MKESEKRNGEESVTEENQCQTYCFPEVLKVMMLVYSNRFEVTDNYTNTRLCGQSLQS